ncbi:Phosphatidylinositol-glycan biosynthesis class W protein [Exaiptasia diaphana]|nr:Phosphatidylinositol-glycan biosynthesis class W protein [Exaiptasia diaphana]
MAEQFWGLSYKQLQANFVSNLNGTSLLEISLLTSIAPLAVLLRSCIGALLWANMASRSPVSSSFVFILDYIILILPLVFVSTILSSCIITTLVTLSVIITTCLILSCIIITNNNSENSSHQQDPKRQSFICNYRAYIVIATAVSILAVDFNIFPRRFAKAETYGSGFMDVGVGSFIVSNAIVSPEARSIRKNAGSRLKCTIQSIRSSIPLLVLGLARFLAVKSTDYQEHISEYGVHWNFFITLFIVKVLSTILVQLPILSNPCTYGLTGFIIAIFYQLSLTRWGLEYFVINGSSVSGIRYGFVDANREGLSSCFGYLALYFMGLQLGRFLFTKKRWHGWSSG